MITLGGVVISDNMFLDGLLNSPMTGQTQRRLIGGESVVFVQPQVGGRTMTLGSQSAGSTQGIWCQSVIEELKVLEAQAQPLTLNYRGATYNVLIKQMDFSPFVQNELEGPNKGYLGTITLVEV
jgi:hypothetical protein